MSKRDSTYYKLENYKNKIVAKMKEEKGTKKPDLKKMELNTNYFDTIMKKYILPKNKDLKYEVYKADTTESVYLRLMYNRADAWLRFSDHETFRRLETLMVEDEVIQTEKVISTIENKLNKLYYKSKMMAFEEIERERN